MNQVSMISLSLISITINSVVVQTFSHIKQGPAYTVRLWGESGVLRAAFMEPVSRFPDATEAIGIYTALGSLPLSICH